MSTRLIAIKPILYESKQYMPGSEIPANNAVMVAAWISAGTAKWQEEPATVAVKVKPATAEPGLTGKTVSTESENGEDLVGKVPKTTTRKKK